MKTTLHALALFVLCATTINVHGQSDDRPRSLFDSVDVSGGFFGFNLRYSEVMRTSAALIGLGAGVVVNDNLNIGLAGAFSSSVIKNPAYEQFLNDSLGLTTLGGLETKFGYGGLFVEPVLFHKSAVHLSLPVLIGAGGINYGYPLPGTDNSDRRSKTAGQAFFAIEPGLELEVRVVPIFRIGMGASYLYTSELDLPETKPDALRTVMLRLSLKLAAG